MKRNIFLGGCLAASATLLLSGCEGLLFNEDRTVLAKASLNNETLLVNADLRAIVSVTPAAVPYPGRVVPRRVICAEPSPDVAKAIATSFGAAASGAASRGDIDAQAAGQLSKSFAEGLVQLGERVSTIQLLRDGLYRACEGYANGVLTDTSYALILGRYGDTMVTLLGAEMAAGAFGRSLAAISSQAAAGGRGASEQELTAARNTLDNADEVVGEGQIELVAAEKKAKEDDKENETTRNENDVAVVEKRKELKAAKATRFEANMALMRLQLQGAAGSFAQTIATPAGAILANSTEKIAAKIVELQANYLDSGTGGALMAACVSTLDHRGGYQVNGRDQQAAATSIANSIRLAERHYGDTVNQRNLALNWAFGAEAKVTATENRIDSIQNKIGVDERALAEADKRLEDAKKLGDQAKIRKEGADVENRQATLKEQRRKLAAEMAQLTQDKFVLAQARANAGRANATVNSAYWNLSATAKGINTTPFGRICMEHVMDKVAKGIDPDERVKLNKSKAAIQELKNKRALLEMKSVERSKLIYAHECLGKEADLNEEAKLFCKSLREEVEAASGQKRREEVEAASGQKRKQPPKSDDAEQQDSLIVPSHPAVAGAEIPATAAARRHIAVGQLPWLAAAPRSNPPSMTQ